MLRSDQGLSVMIAIMTSAQAVGMFLAHHSKDVNYLTYTDQVGIGTTDIVAVRGPKTVEIFWAPGAVAISNVITNILLKRKHWLGYPS
jgi:hypothetical protein